jgi:hypothetical protein
MEINRGIEVIIGYLRVLDNNYVAFYLNTQKWNVLVRGLISIL